MVGWISALAWISINVDSFNMPFNAMAFGVTGLFISTVAALWLEDNLKNALMRHLTTLMLVLLWGVYCLFLPSEIIHTPVAVIERIFGISAAIFIAFFFISFLKRSDDRPYWRFSFETLLQLGVAASFAIVLYGGLCFAVWAIDKLFDIYISHKAYLNLAVACFMMFAPLYFMVNIPSKKEKHNLDVFSNKLLKIFGLYILTPILAIYMLILYAYLVRIITTWTLPDGWVSWLVSALSLGILLVINVVYALRFEGNRFVMWLSRYAGLLVLPLLILMTVGIIRRFNDYGLTVNRLYILLLNIWFYGIFIYLYISKARLIRWILISASCLALLSSIGPWSFTSVTQRYIVSDINNMLSGRQLQFAGYTPLWIDSIAPSMKKQIRERLTYLHNNYGQESIRPFFADPVENMFLPEIFASAHLAELKGYNSALKSDPFAYYSDSSVYINIRDYTVGVAISWNMHQNRETNNVHITTQENNLIMSVLPDDNRISFPLSAEVIDTLLHNINQPRPVLVLASGDYMLTVNKITGTYYAFKDSLAVEDMTGFLLKK
jgi:hypothetical protein